MFGDLQPVKTESRTCFGIAWFATEAEADKAHEIVRKAGRTYNGGFFHGRLCGRDRAYDIVVDGRKLFAVTR